MQQKNKVIFMGTPKIAAICLSAILFLDNVEVVGVICQPDRPIGRKKEIIFSEVKKIAIKNNLKLMQNEKVGNLYDEIKKLKPDLIFTCAFGQFIPDKILNLPKYMSVNLHASLLPKLRGGAPIQWAIINNEQKTGFTLMKMNNKMDAGDIIYQYEIPIEKNETFLSLYDKLCNLAKNIIKNDFIKLFDNKIKTFTQNNSNATFGYNITHENERINWNKSAIEIDCLIRGLYNKPCAYTTFNNNIIKIHKASILNTISTNVPGTITNINNKGIQVATLDKIINLEVIQIAGKKPCHLKQILNGKHFFKIANIFI